MSTKTIKLKVGMTCEGCSGAVTRILSKVPGESEQSIADESC